MIEIYEYKKITIHERITCILTEKRTTTSSTSLFYNILSHILPGGRGANIFSHQSVLVSSTTYNTSLFSFLGP